MQMEMDGGNKEGEGANWSIYRDAFTPSTLSHPTNTNKPKPWERAPVPAHAPRLAGQKIWKKASSVHHTTAHSLAAADKENDVQADLELEMGGMGARKRRRGVPGVGGKGKENIAEARWMVVDGEGVERAISIEGIVSPRKGAAGAGLRDEDAFVVPRKRTNANHLITPRKPLRSIENSVVKPVLQLEQSPVKAATSPAKSPTKGTKVPLNDREGTENADKETEKPRRRKSMRKSRRLTRSDLVEERVEERRGSFVFGQNGGDVVESFSAVVTPLEQAGTQSEETSAKIEQSTGAQDASPVLGKVGTQSEETPAQAEESIDAQDTSPVLEQAAVAVPLVGASGCQETLSPEQEADSMENPMPQAAQSPVEEEAVQHETSGQAEEQETVPHIVESRDKAASKVEEASDGVNENLDKQSGLDTIVDLSTTQGVQFETIEEHAVEAAAVSSDLQIATIKSSELDTISEQAPQTPLKASQLQPATLHPTELDMAIVLSPTKSAGTPRSRRKTPQRSATRRSTRTSRSSRACSVPREETSAQAVPELQVIAPETTDGVLASARGHPVDSATLGLYAKVSKESEQDKNAEKMHQMAVAQTSLEDEQLTDSNTVDEVLHTTETVETTVEVQPEEDSISTEESVREISLTSGLDRQDEAERGSLEQESCDEQLRQEFEISTPKRKGLPVESLSPTNESLQDVPSSEEISEESAENFELIAPMSITTSENAPCSPPDEASEELHESSTPDPTTTELTETISENAPAAVYDHDDTDMLRNFLSKVKANKAAKAKTSIPKRKRSLPHSPLQIPLGTVDATSSPGSPKAKDEFDVSLPEASPSKRRKRNEPVQEAAPPEEDVTEPRFIRRSGRTRLPVKAAPAAPSFIPVRRLGQDGDSTVTLRRNEEKELAALTKVNTRKNKGGASHPVDVLAKKADEKDDPAARQRALKEVFDEKNYKQKLNKKGNTVVWAEELAQFQTEEGKKVVLASLPEKEVKKEGKKITIAEKEPEREKEKPILPGDEKKSVSGSASSTPKVKVGMRSKMTLGMAANGTPAPKRRVRGRS